ncbi:hypothetical protein [Synechococcus phage Yong-M3-232]|nr:hypothetical protein [Synechococcus phage Yong-M3-232]
MTRLRTIAACDASAARQFAPYKEERVASPEAVALWWAAVKMQDAGPQGVDYGLLMIVRDKIDAMMGGAA